MLRHCLFLIRKCMRTGRQLQHSRALLGAQACQQHNLTVRKFDSIVLGEGLIQVDLAKPSDFLAGVPSILVEEKGLQPRKVAIDLGLERKFRTGTQTYSDTRFIHR